jgi:hypothetical protein
MALCNAYQAIQNFDHGPPRGKAASPTGATDEAPSREGRPATSKIAIDRQVRNTYLVNMKYTLADVVRESSAKRRSVQLWPDADIIRADSSTDRKGTGTHRRFGRDPAVDSRYGSVQRHGTVVYSDKYAIRIWST